MFGLRGDFSALERLFTRIQQVYKNEALRIAGKQVLADLKEQMTYGVDAQGRKHTPYTPRYKKKREKAGKQTGVVDFRFTGGLKDSLHEEIVSSSESIVTVDEEHEAIAEGLQTGIGKKKVNPRNLFDVGDKTGQAIEGDIVKSIDSLGPHNL